jgi:hypothetical protein
MFQIFPTIFVEGFPVLAASAVQEQAMDSARRLLAKLLTSDLKAKQVAPVAAGTEDGEL